MARFNTELNSVTCGGREHFAAQGVIEIADELRPFIAALVACGDLRLVVDAPSSDEGDDEALEDASPKGKRVRR